MAVHGRRFPPHLLVEGLPSMSSSSPALDTELHRSSRDLLCGDGWAVFVVPVTLLAKGRLFMAMLRASHFLQPTGIKPLWRPCCSIVTVVSHGALAVPIGVVPGDSEVDFERPEGPDCVYVSLYLC